MCHTTKGPKIIDLKKLLLVLVDVFADTVQSAIKKIGLKDIRGSKMAIFTYSQNLDYAYINGEGDIIKKN